MHDLSSLDGDSIIVRPDHRYPKMALNAVALGVAVWGGYLLLSQIGSTTIRADRALKAVAAVLWLLVLCFVFASLLWTACGAQVISFRGGKLLVRHDLFRIGVGREKVFEVSRVKGVNIEETVRNYRGKETIEFIISLEYDGARQPLLRRLSDRQAQKLRTELARRIHA